MNKRITVDPRICHGKPVIRGTRVLVCNILSSLASGESFAEIVEDYPGITEADIQAALEFGSALSQFQSLPCETTT